MAQLTAEQIYGVARGAGFTAEQAVDFTAIALAESAGRTDALASKGEHSVGLWQINVARHVRKNVWGDLTDPAVNARAAYEISRSGTTVQPWTVTHERNAGTSRDYRRYLDEAQAARTSVEGGTQVLTAAPAVAAEPVTAGASPDGAPPDGAPALDSDRDGVTDAVELELGRSPQQAEADALSAAAARAHAELAPAVEATGTAPTPTGGSEAGTRFLEAARAQAGDDYVFGAETSMSDADPGAFDCSELVQWAAAQAGVEVVDGASNQYLTAKQQGHLISVDEAARTPGALLFSFSTEPQPGGGRPSQAHVAISLGNGSTIEARGSAYGVGEFGVGRRFTYAAVIPGLSGTGGTAAPAPRSPSYDAIDVGPSPWTMDQDGDGLVDGAEAVSGTDRARADSDGDGVSDSAELLRYGTSPVNADTDADGEHDGTEITLGSDPLRVDAAHPWEGLSAGPPLPRSATSTDALLAAAPSPAPDDSGADLIKDLMT